MEIKHTLNYVEFRSGKSKVYFCGETITDDNGVSKWEFSNCQKCLEYIIKNYKDWNLNSEDVKQAENIKRKWYDSDFEKIVYE